MHFFSDCSCFSMLLRLSGTSGRSCMLGRSGSSTASGHESKITTRKTERCSDDIGRITSDFQNNIHQEFTTFTPVTPRMTSGYFRFMTKAHHNLVLSRTIRDHIRQSNNYLATEFRAGQRITQWSAAKRISWKKTRQRHDQDMTRRNSLTCARKLQNQCGSFRAMTYVAQCFSSTYEFVPRSIKTPVMQIHAALQSVKVAFYGQTHLTTVGKTMVLSVRGQEVAATTSRN